MVVDGLVPGYWFPSHFADPRVITIYLRHYSARRYANGRLRHPFIGGCERAVYLTSDCRALWVWTRPRMECRLDGQTGVNCVVFRNEGPVLSSLLVAEADELGWARWPSEPRHSTYVNPKMVASPNPGYCFLKAGWRRCGKSKGGLVILERYPDWAAP